MIRQNRHRSLISLGFLLAVPLLLGGCAQPLEQAVESVASSATDKLVSDATGVDVQGLGSDEIPEDFPSTVPLPDIPPRNATAMTIEGERNWMIQYEGNIDDTAFESVAAGLVANGFSENESSNIAGVMRLALFANSEHAVNLSLMGPADEDRIMQIMVSAHTG